MRYFFIFLLTCCITVFATPEINNFSDGETVSQWEKEGFGNHRVVVHADQPAEVVLARIPWRRVDPLPEHKNIIITSKATGERINNVFVQTCTSELGEILFEAKEVGDYFIYYLPFKTVKRPYNSFPEYLPPKEECAAAWKQKALNTNKLHVAQIIAFEANGEQNIFSNLALPATEEETKVFLEKYQTNNIIFFQESTLSPIQHTNSIPVGWLNRTPITKCHISARPGTDIAMHVGAVAPRKNLIDLNANCIGFKDEKGTLRRDIQLECLNIGGNDFQGMPLMKKISLNIGAVLPLWFTLHIPEDMEEGIYNGDIIFSGWNLRPTSLPVEITIANNSKTEETHLHWLNSTIGTAETLPISVNKITYDAQNIFVNNHSIKIAKNGLINQIDDSLFTNPMELHFKFGDDYYLENEDISYVDLQKNDNENSADWFSDNSLDDKRTLTWSATAHLEADGFIDYIIDISAAKEIKTEDIELAFYFSDKSVPYFMGLGQKGGKRPEFFEWHWSANANQFFWLGNFEHGLWCKLLDKTTRQDTFYINGAPYQDWCADPNAAQITIRTYNEQNNSSSQNRNRYVRLSIHTGAMTISPDQERKLHFRLMLTPFGTRQNFPHKTGVNMRDTVSITTAPMLNYPMPEKNKFAEQTKKIHADNKRAFLRWGTYEIPYNIPEFWTLWSLNSEIYTPGRSFQTEFKQYGIDYAKENIPFIGNSWMCEHLRYGYMASWLDFLPNGEEVVTCIVQPICRWQNYYLEAAHNFVQEIPIDGICTTLAERAVTKRLKNILTNNTSYDSRTTTLSTAMKNEFTPATGMANSLGRYMDQLSLLDWINMPDGFEWSESEAYYTVELSGAPFGINTTFGGNNSWRSMLYGSLPLRKDNKEMENDLDKIISDFQWKKTRFYGFWQKDCPIKIDDPYVLASAYCDDMKMLIVLATFSKTDLSAVLSAKDVDAQAVFGTSTKQLHFSQPEISGLQKSISGKEMLSISVPKQGVAIVLCQIP